MIPESWALLQYPTRRPIVRSCKVSKARDLYLELYNRSDEIWQAPQQQCCWSACQISKRYDNSNYQSSGFEASRDPTIRRLIGYWNGALFSDLSLDSHWYCDNDKRRKCTCHKPRKPLWSTALSGVQWSSAGYSKDTAGSCTGCDSRYQHIDVPSVVHGINGILLVSLIVKQGLTY